MSTTPVQPEKSIEVPESTKTEFSERVRSELEAYAKEIHEEHGENIDAVTITQYVNDIVVKSMSSDDFSSAIEEHGQPDNWENDWIREFIHDHSDWFSKYILDRD